jgi:hypothetical protein
MIPLPPTRTKGPAAFGAAGPGDIGPFGRWPDPRATDDPHPEQDRLRLQTQTLLCGHCEAGQGNGQARTIAATAHGLTVTWHLLSCPHYAADRILAGQED